MSTIQTRPIIAVDIDDVLADNAAGFVAFSNERYGTNLTVEEYDEHWAQVWQIDNAEVERRATELHESGVIRTYTHNESALSVLKWLSERFDLVIVTSRRLQVRDDTLAWIHEHYPGVFTEKKIHFAGIWDVVDDRSVHRTKADIVKELGASYLIDDQLKHCYAAAETGVRALLFGRYRWNKTIEDRAGVVRVSDWSEVKEFFSRVD